MDCQQLTRRLERAERDIARAHAAIAGMRTAATRARRARTMVEVSMLAGLAVAISGMRAPIEAQAAQQTVTAPFVVMSKSGKPILRVREADSGNQNQLLLYNEVGNIAAAIMSTGGRGFIAVGDGTQAFGSQGFTRAALTADSEGNGALFVGDKDHHLIAVIRKGPNTQGLAIYRPGTEKMALTMLADESLAAMVARSNDDVASGISVQDEDGELVLNDRTGQPIAAIGGPDATTTIGELGAAKADGHQGRGLRLFNAKGEVTARAVIDSKGGGNLAVIGGDGSEGLLGTRVDGVGSELILTGPSKVIGAKIVSSDPPGLFLFNPAGQAVSQFFVGDNGGRFWLGDNVGTGMVEGLVSAGGVGIVRAGPRFGGPIEMTGLPFAVLGKK